MLTYPCQSEVLKFLSLEKRDKLAERCPELKKRHKKLPFFIENLKIMHFDKSFSVQIDNYKIWINGGPSVTFIDHMNLKKELRLNCHVDHVIEATLQFLLGRKGTIVVNFTLKGRAQLPLSIPPFKIFNLQIASDDPISKWFHVARGNKLKKLRIEGRAVFDLLDQPEVLEADSVKIATSSTDVQNVSLQKLTKTRYLRFEFVSFLGRYHELSEEIRQISLQNRPIGSIIEYCVQDSFRTKLYPNFAKIVSDLKAERTKINEESAIKIPMKNENAELFVYLIPDIFNEDHGHMWMLRMEVMEKK